MVAISVNSNVVRRLWESRGFTSESLADATGLDEDRLLKILETETANLGELESIADATRVTLTEILSGAFLPHRQVADFRTRGSRRPIPSPRLHEAIELVQNRIDALLDEEIAPRLSGVLCEIYDNHKTAKKCASAMRRLLKIDVNSNGYKQDPLLYWKTRVENLGVIISYFDLEGAAEGFAICENKVGAIVVSSASYSKEAKLFGILHELAHIVRRESAISDHSWRQSTEAWCNKFAAYCLMPKVEIESFFVESQLQKILLGDLLHGLKIISNRFGASMQAAAYHLDNLGLGDGNYAGRYHAAMKSGADISEYESVVEMERGNKHTHYYRKINDLGLAYIGSVGAAVRAKKINLYRASDLLGVKYRYISPLFERAEQRILTYSD